MTFLFACYEIWFLEKDWFSENIYFSFVFFQYKLFLRTYNETEPVFCLGCCSTFRMNKQKLVQTESKNNSLRTHTFALLSYASREQNTHTIFMSESFSTFIRTIRFEFFFFSCLGPKDSFFPFILNTFLLHISVIGAACPSHLSSLVLSRGISISGLAVCSLQQSKLNRLYSYSSNILLLGTKRFKVYFIRYNFIRTRQSIIN